MEHIADGEPVDLAEAGRDVLSFHELHGIEEPPVPGAGAEHLDDVRMVHLGQEFRLLSEALDELRAGRERVADDLDGDGTPERVLSTPVEDAHPALADHLVFVDVEVSGLVRRQARQGRAAGLLPAHGA